MLNGLVVNPWMETLIVISTAVIITVFIDISVKFILSKIASSPMMKSHPWLEAFLRNRRLITVLGMACYAALGKAILKSFSMIPTFLSNSIEKISELFVILMAVMAVSQVTKVINSLYNRQEVAKERPIKGYLQAVEIVAYLLGMIFMLATLLDRSPLILLSGLGAATAVLLLIFRDSILSLVAGIQITMNGSIRVGDWIEMPQFTADGEVLEIALHNVKVQNWDKTITSIPAHKFLEHSFKNWRGMQESGGRRIKRSIFIDVNSICFLDSTEIDQFRSVNLICDYLSDKSIEINEANKNIQVALANPVNFRRLTNIGTFRAYVKEYLKAHPRVNKNLTIIVRQLPLGAEGLPLEIYVFTNDVRWGFYEDTQSDIFDHLLAILPEFGLRIYQKPSGFDFQNRF